MASSVTTAAALTSSVSAVSLDSANSNNINNYNNNPLLLSPTSSISSVELNLVPQWKLELIQRRKQKAAAAAAAAAANPSSCNIASTLSNGCNANEHEEPLSLTDQSPTVEMKPPVLRHVVPEEHQQVNNEDCESDSSEELQYGPGIVKKLKSKYLNMTLREMNKSRPQIQCFRRAASLEDLLDDTHDKNRKYAKKSVGGAAAKVERYRNAARGYDVMKRARSVETLVRYNNDDPNQRIIPSAFKQENDRVVVVDRSTVKIDKDKLKPPIVSKPKRVKPLLAETERPPPDLVKTTMRIFESSSVKKLKPKGEVAVKVATFKNINETFKAQNQKKIVPKPPLQPKPFVNGNSKVAVSPRKILISRVPTVELIEKQKPYHNDNVITDPIIQSVSSVVSKFQQIEKLSSPSLSPEPNFNKIKFSPVPSPEPSIGRAKVSSLDLKSPTTTPVPSPRTTPPKTPQSPTAKSPVEKSPMNSLPSPTAKADFVEQDKDESAEEKVKEETLELNQHVNQNAETSNDNSRISESSSSPETTVLIDSFDESSEAVDSPRTISKSALDNIGKAGVTVQYSFSESPTIKSYLPRTPSNLEDSDDSGPEDESPTEALPVETFDEVIYKEDVSECSSKPMGAISSLSVVKSTMTTSFSQGNESKTIKSQKSESNSVPQKQIGIIRPLVSTKTQLPQQNLSNRELEKNLINRVKSIEQQQQQQQATKVVVSLKSAEEIQPAKKNNSGGGLWDSKPWNQQNNTMVFNFSNRKDVPDYIENDGLIITRKRDKSRQSGDGGVIVSNLDQVQISDDSDEYSIGPPSPCDVAFCNDNVLINGRSNLSRTPRNHNHRIQFDDTATRLFEYPSEASMLLADSISQHEAHAHHTCSSSNFDVGDASASGEAAAAAVPTRSGAMPSMLGVGGLATYTPSKVDLANDGFELGVTARATISSLPSPQSPTLPQQQDQSKLMDCRGNRDEIDYLKPSQESQSNNWGQQTPADMLY